MGSEEIINVFNVHDVNCKCDGMEVVVYISVGFWVEAECLRKKNERNNGS